MNAVTKAEPIGAAPALQMMQSNPIMDMIGAAIGNSETSVDKLSALMDMQERQMNKQAEQAFNVAFAAAMAEMPNIPKSGLNNHTKQKYSTLDDLIVTTRPVLAKHGLALNWSKSHESGDILVTAHVRHAQGHSITTTDRGKPDSGKAMNPLQGGGSTETYLKRYTGFSILGLSSGDEVDDDGRSGGQPRQAPPRDPWTHTILSELPDDATPRDKAMAVTAALTAQFKRMKGEKQLMNEWDRRAHLIEGPDALEGKHPDLHETVCDAYEIRMEEIKEAKNA